MEEKRKLKRRHLIFYLRVFNQKTKKVLGYLVDITEEGIMLISEKPIKTNSVFKLKMDLPEDNYPVKFVEFEAKSLWCKPDINPDFYDTGFQLISTSEKTLEIISNLTNFFGFQD